MGLAAAGLLLPSPLPLLSPCLLSGDQKSTGCQHPSLMGPAICPGHAEKQS